MSPREKRSARDVALDALMQVDKANAWSDEALRRLIAQNGLDSRDAAFATRLCYGVMQNRMLLDYYIGCWCAQKPERLEPVIRSILRIGGYQILFMDRVPQLIPTIAQFDMSSSPHLYHNRIFGGFPPPTAPYYTEKRVRSK